MPLQLAQHGAVGPFAGADEFLDRLARRARLPSDRLVSLAFQVAEAAFENDLGPVPLFGAIEQGLIAFLYWFSLIWKNRLVELATC